MIRILLISILWIVTIIASIIWSYENPEKIEKFKSYFEKSIEPEITNEKQTFKIAANSFSLNVEKILSVDQKTAFLAHPLKEKFNLNKLTIFTQNGFKIINSNVEKLNLPKEFTLQRNGGIKTIINFNNKDLAFFSSNKSDCYYSSLIDLTNNDTIFKTKCLPEEAKNNDFNGLGSSNIHTQDAILLTIGTPEKHSSKNSILAQKDDFAYGKVLQFKKIELEKKLKDNNFDLSYEIYSKGHRVPQGITMLNNKIYSVEHGPKGGDELNLIIKGNNYGWPEVSYGTNYLKDNGGDGVSFPISHSNLNFKEPLFAFVPSVGIASVNNCPTILKNYYNKPCLMATSLYGNQLRKGNSLIIFLLNDEQTVVQSVEKIKINDLVIRHFVTDRQNRLYEDTDGSIYISADKKGIFKIKFEDFRVK